MVTKVTGMMQTGTKGGDIPSASTLVIDTDGDFFDISGTTTINVMTVDAGRRFTLQFDGAVTLTHGSSLYLPGATNFTTEANDCLSFIATAANTVRCTGYALKDGGSPVAAAGGKILQVVQDTLTSAFTTTASSYADITGLAVTITPSSSSSTILVLATINASGTSGQRFGVQLLRGTTPIFVGDAASNRTPGLFGSQMAASVETQSINAHFVDSPATTSATTYKVQGVTEGSNTLYINRTDYDGDFSTVFRTASSIIVMEISS